jgi:hypothetical protein
VAKDEKAHDSFRRLERERVGRSFLGYLQVQVKR